MHSQAKEALIEWFAEGKTPKEVAELYAERFSERKTIRDIIMLKQELSEEIEKKQQLDYEDAKRELSPSGLLRKLRVLFNHIMNGNPDEILKGRKVSDISSLFRVAMDIWKLDEDLKRATEEERKRIEEEIQSVLLELERNKGVLESAEQNGLLRFQELIIGGDK